MDVFFIMLRRRGNFESFSDEELGPRIDQLGADVRSATVELNKNKAVWKPKNLQKKRTFYYTR